MKKDNPLKDKYYAFAVRIVNMYKYLCDKKHESEFVKQKPSKLVLGWMEQQNEQNLYISSITWGATKRSCQITFLSQKK